MFKEGKRCSFWPNMSAELRDFISKCSTCNKMQDQQSKQPLITHDVPKIPWTKLVVDIFTYQNQDYLVTVDYFSDFFELDILTDTSAMTVIDCLKQQFARHGIWIPLFLIMDLSLNLQTFTPLLVIGNLNILLHHHITANQMARRNLL